jgi:hypothetical protein
MRLRTQVLLFLVIQALAVVQALDNARKPFSPREFNKQIATCTVTTRSGNVVELNHRTRMSFQSLFTPCVKLLGTRLCGRESFSVKHESYNGTRLAQFMEYLVKPN